MSASRIPLPYQQWFCIQCLRVFLWEPEVDGFDQPIVKHSYGCKGNHITLIAAKRIGAEKSE